MRKVTFSIGGIHPADSKLTRDCAIETLPLPQTAYVSMAQHLGAPATPIVAVGDKVKVGQVIAEPAGYLGFRTFAGKRYGEVHRSACRLGRKDGSTYRNRGRRRRVGRRHRLDFGFGDSHSG